MGFSRRLQEIIDVSKGYFRSFALNEKADEAPVDFVVTWVDGEDPEWQEERDRCLNLNLNNKEDNHKGRYRAWDSFRYWFRAVEKYAPWVNSVFLVTWGHIPPWLNKDAPKLNIVKHTDFIPSGYLPTFNCNSIEINLFRIKELQEQFIYFNDDVFLARPVKKEEFFLNGKPRHTAVATPWINRNRELPYYLFFNVYGEINKKNNITECIKKNPEKWFSHLYRKSRFENLYPYRNGVIPGMFFSHVGIPFLKTTMGETYKKYEKACDETTAYKFRDIHQITHQLFSIEDIINGRFEPSVNDWGVNIGIEDSNTIDKVLTNRQTKMFCLFDGNYDDEIVRQINRNLEEVFEKHFPEKSSFEL